MFKKLMICASLFALPVAAHAGTYAIVVTEGLTNGSGFNTLPTSGFTGANTAIGHFTYTGDLNFSNTAAQNGPGPSGDLNSAFGFSAANITNYATGVGNGGTVKYNGVQVADFSTLTSFLASSGSASGYAYGSLYKIDLGVLAAGTVLTITHDDGVSVYQGATQINPTVSGPTTVVTDSVKLANAGDTLLYYSRQNGTPSILQVSVPEPMSIALLGAGLAGLGLIRRRQRA